MYSVEHEKIQQNFGGNRKRLKSYGSKIKGVEPELFL